MTLHHNVFRSDLRLGRAARLWGRVGAGRFAKSSAGVQSTERRTASRVPS